MRYHTTDPAERAADIAERAAEQCWEDTHDWSLMIVEFLTVYNQAVTEFLFCPLCFTPHEKQ